MGALMIQCSKIRLHPLRSVSSDTLRCRVLVVERCSLKFINEYNFNFAVPSHSEDVNECIKFHLHNLSSLNSILLICNRQLELK